MIKEITKEMPISEILREVPEAVELMLDIGLHCVGCNASSFETLEQGMTGHGFDKEDIKDFVEDINSVYKEQQKKKDLNLKSGESELEIREGNNIYKLAGLEFTEAAYKALHELKEKAGLQIVMEAGGCSGYKLQYDFQEGPKEDESVYKLSGDLEIYINNFTEEKLKGSTVEFKSGLHGSGLTFINPNTKESCGCGTSFSL